MLNVNKKKVVTLFATTLLIGSLLLISLNMNTPIPARGSRKSSPQSQGFSVTQAPDPIYLHGPPLTPIHMHHVPNLVPIHMHAPGIIDLSDPLGTPWHELYPNFCQSWTLTSWEDTDEIGVLDPSDQIDMFNEETWQTHWFHVDRITMTLLLLDEKSNETIYVEFKGPYDPYIYPVSTLWHEVYPVYHGVAGGAYHIIYWNDTNLDGRLSFCDYIMFEQFPVLWHVEEYSTDLILNEKIYDPICTWWHELYPEFSNLYHISSWESYSDTYCDRLSPKDQIDMDNGTQKQWYTFWKMGDVYGDGYIDSTDLDIIANNTGWVGTPGANPADITEDGVVNILDEATCATNQGTDIYSYFGNIMKKWYFVDRVTLTIYIRINETDDYYYFEYKGSWLDMWDVKTNPICTYWHMVWPFYDYPEPPGFHITDWIDNCNGILDWCDYILLENVWCHVEDVSIDIILNEKIEDPTCTVWHELYPDCCVNDYHILDWEDNDDGLLSPSDNVTMALLPTGLATNYHVDEVTLTLNLTVLDSDPATPFQPGTRIFVEHLGGYDNLYIAKIAPMNFTWEVICPTDLFGYPLTITAWEDTCNEVLSYHDYLWLLGPDGWLYCFVEEVAVDITVTEIVEPVHDVAVIDVYSVYPWVFQGEIDPIEVTVENQGTFPENVTVTAYYDGFQAAPPQFLPMSPGEVQVLTFNWDTSGVLPGFYTVSATASIPADNDPSDNSMQGNVQEVREWPAPPEDLELHPQEIVILGDPTSTQWHELHPSKTNYYHLTEWIPGNILSQHDIIDMYLIEPPEKIYVFTDFVDPLMPICTEWFEESPTPQWWHLSSWEDNNADGILSPSDQIDMTNLDTGEVVWFHVQYVDPPGPEPGPRMMHLDVKYWFQVDEVTVDMWLTPEIGGPQIFVDYKCGFWTFDPANPTCTKWNEIDPELGPVRCLHLRGWEDINLDGKLSPGDMIGMTITYPYPGAGTTIWYYVDFMPVSLLLTPYPMPPVVTPPPVGPVYLESAESYDKFDLASPVYTTWHEIYPVYSRIWHLSSWEDQIALSPSDNIVLTLKDAFGIPIPGTETMYHVDKLTVALNLTSMMDPTEHIVKYERSLKQFVNYYWTNPVSTQWHEVDPTYCRQWHVIAWEDTDANGILDYCDMILMIDKATGWEDWFHVESLSTDIIVSPPPGIHDVAITNVTTSKTGCLPWPTVGQGFTANVTVTVENQGDFAETFNVSVYANATIIGTQALVMNPGDVQILTVVWNTAGFSIGNYSISAIADIVPGETDTADNTFVDGMLAVTRPGDVNGDGFVNAKDAILLGTAFYPAGVYNPNADINNDGYCNAKDAIIIGTNFDT